MSAASAFQALVDYYTNLLIIQYNDQPKARATINLLVGELLANNLALEVLQGYNLDTAVGVQLDVLGKYEGIDRYYRAINLVDFFSLETYTEAPPSSPPRYGFTDYTDYDSTPPNGTLTYDYIVSVNNQLLDDPFLTLIKLKILQNYSNYSDASIDSGLWSFFGSDLWSEDMGNMQMAFFVTANLTPLIIATLYKKVLPRPLTVLGLIVNGITGPMFGFGDYNNYESVYAHGFTDYTDYDSTSGQDLLYSQITVD